MASKTFHTRTVQIQVHENGIYEVTALPEMKREFQLEDMIENNRELQRISGNKKILMLVLISNGKYSSEARKFMAKKGDTAKKIALVAQKPMQRLVGNFFLGINRPNEDTRLFSNREEAVNWLLRDNAG